MGVMASYDHGGLGSVTNSRNNGLGGAYLKTNESQESHGHGAKRPGANPSSGNVKLVNQL